MRFQHLVAWGKKRLQVEALRSQIVEMVMSGMSLPEIHKQLSDEDAIDIKLRAFRNYAAEMRDEARVRLRDEGGPKVIAPDFTRNTEPPARKPKKRAAGRSGQSRPDPTPTSSPTPASGSGPPTSSTFTIRDDAYKKYFGDEGD